MVRSSVCLGVLALACLAMPAAAEDGAAVARVFGAVESIQQISLSPNGTRISYIASAGANQVLLVADLASGGVAQPILNVPPDDGMLQYCSWATDNRIVCYLSVLTDRSGALEGYSRLFAIDGDGKNIVKLTQDTTSRSLQNIYNGGRIIDYVVPGRPNSVLMQQNFVPDMQIGSIIGNEINGLGVDEVDTITRTRHRVEKPRGDTNNYLSDGRGTVRVMSTQGTTDDGYRRSSLRYYYRLQGSKEWKPLSTISTRDDVVRGFVPVAVDAASNCVFGFDDKAGVRALYSIALDGTNTRTLVASRPDVDIDELVRIGRSNRVIGTSYATERRMVDYFDPALNTLSLQLSRALPEHPAVSIVDSSADESKLLLLASSDTNPGMIYLFDKGTRHMQQVLPIRGELAGRALATVTPVTYTAADGTRIPAYLTVPPGSNGKGIPAIVMPHGGPGSRDEWGFDWFSQFFAARGFAVLQPNYRGSSGYGSAWYRKNGFKSWRTAIGDVNDAGRWLVSQGIAAPGKLAIVGWSYGGYAALQTSVLDPDLFKAIIAVAPVTDLQKFREDSLNYTNYPQVNAFIGEGLHVREGSPAQNAERITAPVLMFHGDRDQNVNITESRFMLSRLRAAGKQAELVEFPRLDHQLPNSAVRARMLFESDKFLRRSLGLPAD